jgi:uncharacterized membrane protein YphA (DoxX/SURF4 family)
MNLRTWARILIAISFFLSGLAETLSATGLVAEVSPDRLWGPGTYTLAVGGPLQMAVAALLASGRKTRWALGVLVCYVCLGGALWHLPRIFNPEVGETAIGGLLSSMALLGGILYGLQGERTSSRRDSPAKDLARDGPYQGQPVRHSHGSEDRPQQADPSPPGIVGSGPLLRRPGGSLSLRP